ncbi:MAG: 6,7-dimethyl-8-ribityllumazine synthase [Nitrospinaceae bacterium]
MVKQIEGDLNAKGAKFGIVVSRFNDFITAHLMDGAVDTLLKHGAGEKDIEIVKVPGAFEIPMAAKKMCARKKYDAIICLGAIIRGATPHFNYVCSETSKGVGALAREASIPVLFGVLTTDNLEQAIERAGGKAGNKGSEAALAAIEMVNIYKKI